MNRPRRGGGALHGSRREAGGTLLFEVLGRDGGIALSDADRAVGVGSGAATVGRRFP